MGSHRSLLAASLLLACGIAAPLLAEDADAPTPPAEALKTFRTEPGLRVELVAAEPTIESPCAMAFDERGRLFVAENRGYPAGPKEGEPPAGRVAMLEDRDGDGRYETRTDFATGLTFPNGIMPWKEGLIVTCAPDILYLKDTDGDGKADTKEVLFTGFSTKGSTQLCVSHPTLAIDGWIYVTGGLTGGEVTCPKHPEREPVKFGRSDFRFRPDLSEYEACDGGGQFGLSFDDFGRRFICYNRVQVQHVVLSSKQLKRNPHLAFSDTVQNCPADLAPEPSKGHGQAARLYPISRNVTTADSHAGTFTAACGLLIWRGDGLPHEYYGGAFSCDPTGNLVHFDKLWPNGATFSAKPLRDGVEFLASTDSWFRPVFLSHGPDGALYVIDMYRKTIEHPDYLPVEIRKRTDFESGKDLGRIWRVVKADAQGEGELKRRITPVDRGDLDDLIAALNDDNGWRRDSAFRLLLEQPPEVVDPRLIALLGSRRPSAALALSLLERFGALHAGLVEKSLSRPNAAEFRELLVDAAATRLRGNQRLIQALVAAAKDKSPRVRFRTAIALGEVNGAGPINGLAKIAARDAADRWTRAAVLSSIHGREIEFVETLYESVPFDLMRSPVETPGVSDLMLETGRIIGAADPDHQWRFSKIPRMYHFTPRAAALLSGYCDANRNRGIGRDTASVLQSLSASYKPDRDEPEWLQIVLELALRIAAEAVPKDDEGVPDRGILVDRKVSIDFLGNADFATAGPTLLKLVDPREPVVLQAAALRGLSRMRGDSIAAELLSADRFPAYTPQLREEVLAAMLTGPQHLPGLLDALEKGVVPKGAIDALRRRQLLQHRDEALRARAGKLFLLDASSDRAKVYDELKSVVALAALPANGKAVFKRVCASCHRLDQEGSAVGPDLFGIRNQPKEAILLHIVVPDHEITPGFTAYVLTTKEGRVLTGLVTSETATSVTLRQPLGKEESVLRSDIEELVASRLSLMPQNVETQVTRQEFADLLAYLKGER